MMTDIMILTITTIKIIFMQQFSTYRVTKDNMKDISMKWKGRISKKYFSATHVAKS